VLSFVPSETLPTLQFLHTYSINAGPEIRAVLVSDLLYSAFATIQTGKSNTLAAGLAQLLYDWKHMFRYDFLKHVNTTHCDCSYPAVPLPG
jgi:hypothetical protein